MVTRLISSEITAMTWAAQAQMPAATACPAPTAPKLPAKGCRSPASPELQSQANQGRFPADQGWTAAGGCLGSQQR